MPDANGFVKAVKRAALDAVEAARPVNVYFGRVVSVSPLKINVEQKMILGAGQLVLARNVTDFRTKVTVDWESEPAEAGDQDHTHEIAGKKEITLHNALTAGDEVILVRQQEGQKYIVIDRTGVVKS